MGGWAPWLWVVGPALAWAAGLQSYHLRRRRPLPVATALAAAGATLVLGGGSWRVVAAAVILFWHAQRTRAIGLTGTIASGKSTVSAVAKQCGAEIIDADKIARDIVEPDQPAFTEIVRAFGGAAVLTDKGDLDRGKLRALIINDPAAKRRLNGITHPRIATEIVKQLAWYRWMLGKTVVIDAPLLFESGPLLRALCSPIVVVASPVEQQVARVMARDGVDEDSARKIIAAQMPQERKVALADIVVRNDAGLEELQAAARTLFQRLGGGGGGGGAGGRAGGAAGAATASSSTNNVITFR